MQIAGLATLKIDSQIAGRSTGILSCDLEPNFASPTLFVIYCGPNGQFFLELESELALLAVRSNARKILKRQFLGLFRRQIV